MAGRPLLMVALTAALTLIFAVMAFRAQHPLERGGLCAGRRRCAWQHYRPSAAGCRDRFP